MTTPTRRSNINNNNNNKLLLTPTPFDLPQPKSSASRRSILPSDTNKLLLTPFTQLDLTATPNTPKALNTSSILLSEQIATPQPQYNLINDEKYSAQNYATFPPTVAQILKNNNNNVKQQSNIKATIEGDNVCLYNNEKIYLWKNSLLTKKIPKCFTLAIANPNHHFPFIQFVGKNGLIAVTSSGDISLWFNPFLSTPPLTERVPLSSSVSVSALYVFLNICYIGTSNNEVYQVTLTENFEVDATGKFSFENSKPALLLINKWAPKSKTFLGFINIQKNEAYPIIAIRSTPIETKHENSFSHLIAILTEKSLCIWKYHLSSPHSKPSFSVINEIHFSQIFNDSSNNVIPLDIHFTYQKDKVEVLLSLENIIDEDEEEDEMKLEEEEESEERYIFGVLKISGILSHDIQQKFNFIKKFESKKIEYDAKLSTSIENNIKVISIPSSSSLLLLEKFDQNNSIVQSKITPKNTMHQFQIISAQPFADQQNQILYLTTNGILCLSLPHFDRRKECLTFSKAIRTHFQKPSHVALIKAYHQFVKGKSPEKIDLPNLQLRSILDISNYLINTDPFYGNEIEKQHEEFTEFLYQKKLFGIDSKEILQLQTTLLENSILFHTFIRLKSTNRFKLAKITEVQGLISSTSKEDEKHISQLNDILIESLNAAIEYQTREETQRKFNGIYSSIFFNNEIKEIVHNRIRFSLSFIQRNHSNDQLNLPSKMNSIFEQLRQLVEILFYLLKGDDFREAADQQMKLLNEIYSFPNLQSKSKEIAIKFHQFQFLIENFIGDNEDEIEYYFDTYFAMQSHLVQQKFRYELFRFLENTRKFKKLFQPNPKYNYTKGDYKEDLKNYLKSHLPENAWLSSVYYDDYSDLVSIAKQVDDFDLQQKKFFFSLSKIGSIISANEDQKVQCDFQLFIIKYYEQFSLKFQTLHNPVDHFDYFLSLSYPTNKNSNNLLDSAYDILLRLLEMKLISEGEFRKKVPLLFYTSFNIDNVSQLLDGFNEEQLKATLSHFKSVDLLKKMRERGIIRKGMFEQGKVMFMEEREWDEETSRTLNFLFTIIYDYK